MIGTRCRLPGSCQAPAPTTAPLAGPAPTACHLLTFHLPLAAAPQMASNGEKVAGLVWVLAFFLAFSGGCLVLAGLASMQSLCHNDG